jgi:hypothetical protein
MTGPLRPCDRCGGLHSRHPRAVYCVPCFLQLRRDRNDIAKLNNAAAGKCLDCGKDRGEAGTTIRCRPCQDRRNEWQRMRDSELAETAP